MARQYSTREFFRQMPNVLLARYFQERGLFGDLDFAILKEVQHRLERDVSVGAVHATLERLEGKALVASHLGSGTDIRSGRARRFYRLKPSAITA